VSIDTCLIAPDNPWHCPRASRQRPPLWQFGNDRDFPRSDPRVEEYRGIDLQHPEEEYESASDFLIIIAVQPILR
jgi:hypothetical protein